MSESDLETTLAELAEQQRRVADASRRYVALRGSTPARLRAFVQRVRQRFGGPSARDLRISGSDPFGFGTTLSRHVLRPYLDVAYYLRHNPDVADAADPVEHFFAFGVREGRHSHPLFEPTFYRAANPDADAFPGGPLAHYLCIGVAARRSPHPLFDAEGYARAAGVPGDRDPLLAYLECHNDGPDPHPLFRTASYLERRGAVTGPALIDYLADPERPDPHPLIDGAWYRAQHGDVAAIRAAPLHHYLQYGSREGRAPHPWFDPSCYRARYPDVAAAGIEPLVHWVTSGWREERDPHPGFHTPYYVDRYLGGRATTDPLVFFVESGRARGDDPDRFADAAAFLPVSDAPPAVVAPPIDIVVPIYGGTPQTQACITSVLASRLPPDTRIIAIDDASPEPELRSWLRQIDDPRFTVLANDENRGFVATANRGMSYDDRRDVLLLNSDTLVAGDWVQRLARAAYASDDVGTVTPFSNNATIASYPRIAYDNAVAPGATAEIDAVAARVNAGRTFDVPTAVGFCMYVRRDALELAGCFDEARFGRGYGEENDFSRRLIAAGRRNVLAADVFVHHAGGVSFGGEADERKARALELVEALHPGYLADVRRHLMLDPALGSRFAIAAGRMRARTGILLITHALGGGIAQHVDDIVALLRVDHDVVLLEPLRDRDVVRVSVAAGDDPFVLELDGVRRFASLVALIGSLGLRRAHVHHVAGYGFDVARLIEALGLPFDVTVHDYFGVCPQVTMTTADGRYCGEPEPSGCNACLVGRPTPDVLDIASWRERYRWMFADAERIIAPSQDTAQRIARYHPRPDIVIAAHPE